MQTVSATYSTLLAADAHREVKAVIAGVTYDESKIVSCKTSVSLMKNLSIGNAVSRQLDITLYNPGAIPRMAEIDLYVRLYDGTTQSEWLPKGVFFIDTRDYDAETDVLTIHGFDAMLKADQAYFQGGTVGVWPRAANIVVSDICTRAGFTLSADTSVSTTNMVDFPNDYTMREVLGHIAAAQGGNWYFTDDGKLRLLPLTGTGSSMSLGRNEAAFETSPALAGISRVTLFYDATNAFTAGDDTGYALDGDCPWATQNIVNAVLTSLSGYVYRPFEASDAIIDPAAELGDGVVIDNVTYPIMQIEAVFDAFYTADITAPQDQVIDHEYPYLTRTERALQRKVTLGESYYGTTITRADGLQIKRSDGKSEATFNSDRFQMSALIDNVMTPRIYFDPVKGDFVFDGALGADAVFTDSLYAETGDIAELTVDRLSTSRRVRKYILGDTSDDNYIKIEDQHLRFIAGSVVLDENDDPVVVQAQNRYGNALYWQREPVGHTDSGYPLDANGKQIYASTDQTLYPVYQYDYSEAVKASIEFELVGSTYVPTLTMGVGYGQQLNPDRGKGFVRKNVDSFDLWMETATGLMNGLFVGDDYTDLYGLRRPTAIDFSTWNSGLVTETLDGNVTNSFAVEFDANGQPIKFTTSDGHETVVSW